MRKVTSSRSLKQHWPLKIPAETGRLGASPGSGPLMSQFRRHRFSILIALAISISAVMVNLPSIASELIKPNNGLRRVDPTHGVSRLASNKQSSFLESSATNRPKNTKVYKAKVKPTHQRGAKYNNHHPSYNRRDDEIFPFEPKSDENCPMTGPLTVCDQIGSYPFDIILYKLEAVKRSLGDNYFNLDSLFSDEREHSLDPFEDEKRIVVKKNRLSPYKTHYSSAEQHDRERSAASYQNHEYPAQKLVIEQDDFGSDQDESMANNKQADDSVQGHQNSELDWRQDEFVDLVERQAIRLNPVGDSLRKDRKLAFERRDLREPIIISGLELAEGLLNSVGEVLSSSTNINNISSISSINNNNNKFHIDRNSRGYQSYRESSSSDGKLLPRASSWLEARPSAQRRLVPELRRPRRQASPSAELGDASGSSASVDPSSNQLPDQEPASDGLNEVEPVCRAKSIYISPRAALNDKKQWKYVVNAAERDPQVRQIIRVDICEDPFGPCSDQISLPFGFTSQCKQKYSKKRLLALDSQSGLLEVDTFFVPSCCVCQLVRERRLPFPSSLEGPEEGDSAAAISAAAGGGSDSNDSDDGSPAADGFDDDSEQPATSP